MKIISKRARQASSPKPEMEVTEVFGTSIIISSHGEVMSPDDIKRIGDMFRDIRKQLEDFGKIQSP